jgi:hypothetical protein
MPVTRCLHILKAQLEAVNSLSVATRSRHQQRGQVSAPNFILSGSDTSRTITLHLWTIFTKHVETTSRQRETEAQASFRVR